MTVISPLIIVLFGILLEGTNEIKIALLLPKDGQDFPTIGSSIGALDLAVQKINKNNTFEYKTIFFYIIRFILLIF